MKEDILPAGKLPVEMLGRLLKDIPRDDEDVVIGPGIGEDAAVISFGERMLVFKTDPITFATEDISWYLVTVNSNDIACMGGIPKYLLVSVLLPEKLTTEKEVKEVFDGLREACSAHDITLVGGHTEITHGLSRVIATGCMIGEIAAGGLVRNSEAKAGDAILLSKGIPIEALSLLAREMPGRLDLDGAGIKKLAGLIHEPGISVFRDARIACETGGVHALHDPTEGGLATGLAELASASGCGLEVRFEDIPMIEEAEAVLSGLGIDPLGAIASGSLLVCCEEDKALDILEAWKRESIDGAVIGKLTEGEDLVMWRGGRACALPVFATDEIARVFSSEE